MTTLEIPPAIDRSLFTPSSALPIELGQEAYRPDVDSRSPRNAHRARERRSVVATRAKLDARLASEELALAALIHLNLMSIRLPSVSFASLDGITVPCRAIGGDFFDAVALGDYIYAVVADVSGKGMPAAIVAATLQGMMHALMLDGQPLDSIATTVNQFLCSRATGKYATMVLLKLCSNGTAEYLNCGHVAPFIVRRKAVSELEGGSTVVGLLPDARYATRNFTLVAGERILIFTDGVTEAENARGQRFGDIQVRSLLQLRGAAKLLEEVSFHQGRAEQQDDRTVFELEFRP